MPKGSLSAFRIVRNAIFMTYVFFFSSRRRHTRSDRDWSSDVCSSDLIGLADAGKIAGEAFDAAGLRLAAGDPKNIREAGERLGGRIGVGRLGIVYEQHRSEERRVGKECRSRWSPYH